MSVLSIIIPAYNAEKYIEHTVQTIVCQKYSDYEVIIVDDGSKDSTAQICKRLAESDERIRVFSRINAGVSAARNFGLSVACGKWITFIDADDGLLENAFDRLDDYLKTDSELILFGYESGNNKISKGSGGVNQTNAAALRKCILNYPQHVGEIRKSGYQIDNVNNWTCWGKIYRKDIIERDAIAFPEGITHGEDLIFLYKYVTGISIADSVDKTIYYYRTDNASVTRGFNPKRIENTKALFGKLQEVLLNDDTLEFTYFVCNRVFACCYLYFACKGNKQKLSQRKYELESLCNMPVVADSLSSYNSKAQMSMSIKTNFFMKKVLNLLSLGKYVQAIWYACFFNLLSR